MPKGMAGCNAARRLLSPPAPLLQPYRLHTILEPRLELWSYCVVLMLYAVSSSGVARTPA